VCQCFGLPTQEKAELESTVVLLRAELERAPLVPRESVSVAAEDSAADGVGAPYTKTSALPRAASEDVVAAPASPGAAAKYRTAEMQQRADALEVEMVRLQDDRSDLRATVKELRLELQRLEVGVGCNYYAERAAGRPDKCGEGEPG
jgi:hypothetical protein